MTIEVREATTQEERESVFRLRYEVYVKEMGRRQTHADHARERLEEPFDANGGHLFLAEDDGVPVGTVRVNLLREGALECQELYAIERFAPFCADAVSMTTKLMVKKSHRGAAASWHLATAAYRFMREAGIRADFIDTNPHLVRMYQRFGYRFYEPNIMHPDYGSVIPMVFLLEDLDHMEAIGSPFLELARQYPRDGQATPFFREVFGDYASIVPTSAMSEDEFWRRFGDSLGVNEARRGGFLQDLSDTEVQEFLRHFDPITYEPGDIVMKEGDSSQGMFCLLDGQAEVRSGTEGIDRLVDLLLAGEVCGEMGFLAKMPRSASIIVRERSRLLVLTEPEFRRFASGQPELAIKILLQLLTIVVERFHFRINPTLSDAGRGQRS